MQEIVTSLVAIRSKLKRSDVLRTNVIYEVRKCAYQSNIFSQRRQVFFEGKVARGTIPEYSRDTIVRPCFYTHGASVDPDY